MKPNMLVLVIPAISIRFYLSLEVQNAPQIHQFVSAAFILNAELGLNPFGETSFSSVFCSTVRFYRDLLRMADLGIDSTLDVTIRLVLKLAQLFIQAQGYKPDSFHWDADLVPPLRRYLPYSTKANPPSSFKNLFPGMIISLSPHIAVKLDHLVHSGGTDSVV